MSRCYAEITRDGKIDHLVYQDETGVYDYVLRGDGNGKFVPAYMLRSTTIKLPGEKPKKVMTNERDFLEFARLFERNMYMETTPTEIREYEGTREEVIQAAMKDFGQARLDS